MLHQPQVDSDLPIEEEKSLVAGMFGQHQVFQRCSRALLQGLATRNKTSSC